MLENILPLDIFPIFRSGDLDIEITEDRELVWIAETLHQTPHTLKLEEVKLECEARSGINGFIKAAALEFSCYGITVNGVEPGNILTEGMKIHRSPTFIKSMEEAIPLGRLGTPRDVANAFLFLASEEASFITGTTIVVDGGQLLPEASNFRINTD